MIRRRRFLRAVRAVGVVVVGGPLALAGCQDDGAPERSGDDPGSQGNTPAPEPDPDLPLLGRLVESERELVQAYARTVGQHADLKQKLAPFVKRQQQHAEALTTALRRAQRRSQQEGSRSPTPTTTPSVPMSRAEAVGRLARSEQVASQTHVHGVETAHSGELARLLASIAACKSLHADELDRISREGA